jgi:serine/threonine-protein phosphatase PP1 catalytic subunit
MARGRLSLPPLERALPGEAEFTAALDRMIRVLFRGRCNTADGYVRLDLGDLHALCDRGIQALARDPLVLRLDAPITLCGDIHGQYCDLLRLFRLGGRPPATRYLFLGDYVDRGANSVECFALLLALKVRFPASVWLLRGNHETPGISQMYGFFAECALRYGQALWGRFVEVFRWLPLAAVVGGRIFCVHGGLSPGVAEVRQLEALRRPIDIPPEGPLTDLLWADPSPAHAGFAPSDRGTSFTFGLNVVHLFLEAHAFELIVRGHQVVAAGFAFPFRPDRALLTLFSAPNYCGQYDNLGALMRVDEDLHCSFEFVAAENGPAKARARPPTPGAASL